MSSGYPYTHRYNQTLLGWLQSLIPHKVGLMFCVGIHVGGNLVFVGSGGGLVIVHVSV